MTPPARLGGFKILDDVVRISLDLDGKTLHLPAECCRVLAEKKINLNFFSSVDREGGWGVDLLVGSGDASAALDLLSGLGPAVSRPLAEETAVLSVFPHRNNPAILADLLRALSLAGIRPRGLANSPSALSVVLEKTNAGRAAESLFEPFQFSAYRTPSDWKLAQKGKEQLYKEVIASFEETRPKVYFLEYEEDRELLQMDLSPEDLPSLGDFFTTLNDRKAGLGFLATGSPAGRAAMAALLLLPRSVADESLLYAKRRLPGSAARLLGPVAGFSMNGPHFGDRYGLACELLRACRKAGVTLLGLGCSIATISGVVPAGHLRPAIECITSCFEVPSVVRKE